jgi:GGDEF domain-containing protein
MSISRRPLSRFSRAALELLQQPVLLAFVPALGLGWCWFGAFGALWIGAIAVPLVAISSENLLSRSRRGDTDSLTGLMTRNALIDEIDEQLKGRDTLSSAPAVLVIEIHEAPA